MISAFHHSEITTKRLGELSAGVLPTLPQSPHTGGHEPADGSGAVLQAADGRVLMQHRDIQYAFRVGLFAFMHVDMWVGVLQGVRQVTNLMGMGAV